MPQSEGLSTSEIAALAERFFRGVYAGDPSVVDEIAADDIIATYPIFKTIFGSATIRGKQAYKRHAVNFSKTWSQGQVTIHDTVVQQDRVVLLWSFQARRNLDAGASSSSAADMSAWGGITLFRFDAEGRIAAEIGEESEPGPFLRSTLT